MLIYIKTPFYKNSKYIPHLVEHCVDQELNMSNDFFLKNIFDVEAEIYSTLTVFDIPDYFDVDNYLKELVRPLDKEIIKNEQRVLKEELKKSNYGQRLFEKIGKHLHGEDFNNNSTSKVELDEVIKYHKKYYKIEKMIICTDKYEIIKKIKSKNKYLVPKNKKNVFKYFSLRVRGYTNKIIYSKYLDWQDYYLFFFIDCLLNAYFALKYRFRKRIYYNDKESTFYRTEKYNILAIDGRLSKDFDEQFFLRFKKNFFNIVKYDYGKKGIVINKLILDQDCSIKQINDYIKKLEFLEIKKILKTIW